MTSAARGWIACSVGDNIFQQTLFREYIRRDLRKNILFSFWDFAFSGRASCIMKAPAPRFIAKSFLVKEPFEKVWTAAIEAFSDMSLPILNMEKASGLVETDWIDFTHNKEWNRYADCSNYGTIELGTWKVEKRRAEFSLFVNKTPEELCEVKIDVFFSEN